jgi:hypothetical protein
VSGVVTDCRVSVDVERGGGVGGVESIHTASSSCWTALSEKVLSATTFRPKPFILRTVGPTNFYLYFVSGFPP